MLVTARVPGDGVARLRAAGHEVTSRDVDSPMPRDDLLAAVAGAEALVAMLVDRVVINAGLGKGAPLGTG
ncbi:MAG TPA: hypothetical protein VFI44_01620, partial [Ornithinibacter sp.]|nr:hypothetical protein [Ornithinibacter sp.]